MRTTKTETNKVTVITCDECQGPARKICHGCRKDLCARCGNWWHQDLFTGDDNGDYPPLVCNACHELAKQTAPNAIEIMEDAWDQVGTIIQDWKDEASNHNASRPEDEAR